jgi:hypothetical protein
MARYQTVEYLSRVLVMRQEKQDYSFPNPASLALIMAWALSTTCNFAIGE